MIYTMINKFSVDHSSDVSHCFAGEDTEYQPLREEESSSESGGASDSDFSVSSPPQKKTKAAAKPKHQKTATATKRPTGGGERKKRTREVGADINKDNTKPSPTTGVHATKPHVKRVTATVASRSPMNTTAVESRSSSQPAAGCNGTPGLGMRRMPHWTPPGEGDFRHCFLLENFCFVYVQVLQEERI